MPLRVALYSPDRAIVYDGRTPEQAGVGGGITARLSLLPAIAALGHDVTAYVNCLEPVHHEGVWYVPLDAAKTIDTDLLIAISTGGALTFAPLRHVEVRARSRIVWVQGVPKPADLDAVQADRFVAASRFLRDVIVERWRVPAGRVCSCYNGIHQERFEAAARNAPARDPHALAYIGPPEKGLSSAIEVLRRLRRRDPRYHLDVFGGGRLWGRADDETPVEPGVRPMGMVGQSALVPQLFEYEYCLAPQAMEEGFGIGLQEARRAGQIVLASRVGAFGELIRDGYDGYLIDEPHTSGGSHERMAGIISSLAIDPTQRARLRRRGIEAASTFSWTQAARTFVEYCEDGLQREAGLKPAPPTVLLTGYYGHGNLGDEVILQALLAELRAQRPSLQVVVASGNPAETRAVHRVDAIHERDLAALSDAISRSRAVVAGGGGLFHDHFGVDETTLLSGRHWGLTQLAGIAALADRHRVPFAILGAGVGPLSTADGQRYTRLIFERAGFATVRDDQSRALLEAVGVPKGHVEVAADPAWLLESPTATEVEDAEDTCRFISVVLRSWDKDVDQDAWQRAVAYALDLQVEATGATVRFISFQSTTEDRLTGDAAVSQRVRGLMRHRASAVIAPADLSPADVQRLFAASDAVLCMRLHGVVLAAAAGAPVVALAYDPKVRSAMRQLGREAAVVDLVSVNAHTLSELLLSVLSDRSGTGETVVRLRESARANVARFVKTLDADAGHMPAATREWTSLVRRTPLRQAAYQLGHDVRRAARTSVKSVRHMAGRYVVTRAARMFRRYRRARMATYGASLEALRAPGEPGLVSIILPVWNGAAFVATAIESILRQTHSQFELIVIDDGSTDGTAEIVDAAAAQDARIRVVHQENQKLPAALSRGFSLARGEFLTWTSADNRLKPECLEKLVACLRRHPSWDVTYANLDIIGEDGRPWRSSPHYEKYQRPHGSEHVALPATTRELNVIANNSIGAAFLYRNRVPALVGDYSRHRFVTEDYDYWMRANAVLTVRHADFSEPVYDYRFHRQSLTSRWEEFEMLRHRERLMVFDDFRRDFFMSPMLWVIDGPATSLAASLEEHVRAAGHLVYNREYSLADLPQLSVPVVYAHVTHEPASGPRIDLPPGALKALVTGAEALAGRPEGWDVGLVLGSMQPPQGWLVAGDIATLFHALDIRAKSDHVAKMEAAIECPPPTTCKATVIICTRGWNDRLERALDAIATQRTAHSFEVIVVENSTVPSTPNLNALPMYRLVRCPIPGLSAARNAGLAEARGEIVCFLDDDAVPEREWLDWICRAFDEHRGTGVVGGHIRLNVPEAPPPALRPRWRKYWSEFLTGHVEFTEVAQWARFPYGANWSAQRDLLRAVGGFRSRYGRTGSNYWGGEEIVAASLIHRLGGRIGVEPRAVVLHDVDPSRFTLSHVVRSMVAVRQVYRRAQDDLYAPR